jgi:glycosyltransferase involved in cell wall biosynthesis
VRIAAFGQYWYPEQGGGLDRYFYEMVKYLALHGHDVDFFTVGAPPALHHGARGFSFADPAASLPLRLCSAYARFGERLKRQPYDVLNFHFSLYAAPAVPHRKRDTPLVTHFHGPWAQESLIEGDGSFKYRIKKTLERSILNGSQRFVTLSNAFADLLSTEYRFSRDMIDVIPMGVDIDAFTPLVKQPARERLGWPNDRFILFTARRLVKRVGLYELIEAIAQLPQRQDVWLAVAGRGPEAARLQTAIDERGLGNTIRLLGYVSEEDLAIAYAAADLTIVPSQKLEGFGAIIPESLASGTPVAVTPIGGMPEYVRPLDARLICTGVDARSISQSLSTLMYDAASLPSAAECRTYAEATFSWPRVAQQLYAVFAQANSH